MAVAAAVVGAVLVASAPASAQESTAPSPVLVAAEVETLCTPTEPGLEEVSGVAVVGDRIFAIGDSGSDQTVWILDHGCAVTGTLDVPVDSYDVEDLAVHDGRLWLADTGDNDHRRDSVALTSMDVDSGAGGLHRLTYPDTAHDAEALLVGADGRPVIVTKVLLGQAGIHVADDWVGALASPGPSPLRRVGQIRLGPTDTPGGPVQAVGSTLVTGGAVSADGRVVALRTYTDAYLFAAPDGDVVAALTTSTPIRIPLPDEPQGEAIAFTDAGDLLTASESNGGPPAPIRIVRGATELVPMPEGDVAPTAGAGVDRGTAVAVAVGAVVVLGGAFLALRRRRD